MSDGQGREVKKGSRKAQSMKAPMPAPPANRAPAAATRTSSSLLTIQRGSADDDPPPVEVADMLADEPAATAAADCEGRRPDRLALPETAPEAAAPEAVVTAAAPARPVTPLEMEETVSAKQGTKGREFRRARQAV